MNDSEFEMHMDTQYIRPMEEAQRAYRKRISEVLDRLIATRTRLAVLGSFKETSLGGPDVDVKIGLCELQERQDTELLQRLRTQKAKMDHAIGELWQ